MLKLKKLNPEGLSNIKVSYFKGESRISEYHTVLLIKFSGTYNIGSSGNEDARYMYAKGELGLHLFQPNGVVLDFTELEYQWGDMIDLVFDIGSDQYIDKDFPSALVLGEKCKEAIGTLIHGIDSKKSATTQEDIFDSFEDAWEYVENKIKSG